MADSERLSAPGCWLACTSFSRTKKGILLFAEIILCLVILICFSASTTSAYSSLSVIEMIFAAVLFVFYMCDLHSKISFINWPWTVRKGPAVPGLGWGWEDGMVCSSWLLRSPFSPSTSQDFFRSLIATILYLITSIVVLVEGRGSSRIVAGILGLLATLLFGYDAYITFPLKQQRHTAAPTDPTDGP
ncbi:proteolipid protein 2 isoform X1 [Mastomys coucha]|uniref:proteolipid protein 2 isoform X1 n=1 Tax=Mastomys coucha TaxID=35658 RepID=UPI001261D29C|nr:proteolipid protein 2 isoform X1 [Mastomys coucha]